MKRQKAFTLIELLAVIVILAVIVLITSPIIMGVIGKTKKQAFERSIDGILEAIRLDYAVEGFVVPREYFYNNGELTLLRLGEEVQNKTIAIKGKIEGNGFIYVDEEGIRIDQVCSSRYCATGKEDSIIITENEDGKIPEYNVTDPMISLNGSETIYVGLNETYTELGVVAKTIGGQALEYTSEITLDGEVVTSIDTTSENTYVITYQTTNEGKTVTTKRNVVVVNMTPVITLTEANTKYVKEQEILITASAIRPNTITSFTVEIKKDGEVIETETVNGISKTITFNETGNYEIEVSVTDSGNHKKSMTSGVYKIDKEKPTIEFTSEITLKANEVSGFVFSEDDTVVVSDNSNLVTWKTEGNLNSTIVEDQTITYIAIDEAGNETRKIRTFHIDEAKEPSINFSSPGSNGIWIKAITVTLYARIEIDNDELTAFTYQVDDGEIVNVPITNNKEMEASVDLNTTGRHTIKITATGKHGNTNEKTIGEFLIDVTASTVGEISGNTDIWAISKTLTSSITDSDSKVKYYAFIKDSATKPTENSAEWKEVTASSPYSFSQSVTENGTYYLWAKDSAGNISASKSVIVDKIDDVTPTLRSGGGGASINYGENKELSTLFLVTYGGMGGSVVCQIGDKTVTNVNEIKTSGSYSIKCTAIGNNGKSSNEVGTSIRINNRTFSEIMNASSEVATNDPGGHRRYVGANPNNYVKFNNELWRIIGILDAGTKIIRYESLGQKAWDVNGKNNWPTSSLCAELNDTYYAELDERSQQYIEYGRFSWKLGGSQGYSTREQFYNEERGTDVYTGNSTTWTGPIGLMYASDYGYATSSTSSECDEPLFTWKSGKEDCKNNNWLWTKDTQYLLNSTSSNSWNAYYALNTGGLEYYTDWNTSQQFAIRPVVYLKSVVRIYGGTGTSEDPYILGT